MSLILPLQEAVRQAEAAAVPLAAARDRRRDMRVLRALRARQLPRVRRGRRDRPDGLAPAHSPWTTAVQVPRALLERVSSPRPSQRRRADTAGLPRRARAPGRVLRRRHAHVPAANLPRDHDPQPHGHAQKLGAAVQRDGRAHAHASSVLIVVRARAPARARATAPRSRLEPARARFLIRAVARVRGHHPSPPARPRRRAARLLPRSSTDIYPAAIHLKLVPKSRWKALDRVVVVCGFFVSAFCTFVTIKTYG